MYEFDKNDANWLYYYDSSRSRLTFRGHQKFGIGERDILSSTNVTKVHNVSINLNAQIFGERCYRLYALSFFGT